MSTSITNIRFHEFGAIDRNVFELVGDFIPSQGVGLLVGEKSLGKTFNSIELAVCLATGRPYAGVYQISFAKGVSRAERDDIGATLFILSEGTTGFQKRLDAARLNLSETERAKLISDWDSDSLPIACMRAPRMATEQEFKMLLDEIVVWQRDILSLRANVKLELIVIDTIPGAFVGLDENRTSDAQEMMSRLMRLSEATDTVVAGVTHPTKNGSKREPKGSVNLGGSADFILSITKSRGRGNYRDIFRTKVKDGPDKTRIARYRLATVDSTHERTSQVVEFEPVGGNETAKEHTEPARASYSDITLEAIGTAMLMHSTAANGHTSPAVNRLLVRDIATTLAQDTYTSNTDNIHRSVNRVIENLINAGRVVQTKSTSDDGKACVLISMPNA